MLSLNVIIKFSMKWEFVDDKVTLIQKTCDNVSSNFYVIYLYILRHNFKFAHVWQLSSFIWTIPSARNIIVFSLMHVIFHSFDYVFLKNSTQLKCCSSRYETLYQKVLQFSSSWLTYACQLSYSNTQLFFQKRICWKRALGKTFSTFFCAFLCQPDLSDIFLMFKDRQLYYITRLYRKACCM